MRLRLPRYTPWRHIQSDNYVGRCVTYMERRMTEHGAPQYCKCFKRYSAQEEQKQQQTA